MSISIFKILNLNLTHPIQCYCVRCSIDVQCKVRHQDSAVTIAIGTKSAKPLSYLGIIT